MVAHWWSSDNQSQANASLMLEEGCVIPLKYVHVLCEQSVRRPRASHTSLQLFMVNLQLFKFLLMMSLHLHNAGLELLGGFDVYHGCWGRIRAF